MSVAKNVASNTSASPPEPAVAVNTPAAARTPAAKGVKATNGTSTNGGSATPTREASVLPDTSSSGLNGTAEPAMPDQGRTPAKADGSGPRRKSSFGMNLGGLVNTKQSPERKNAADRRASSAAVTGSASGKGGSPASVQDAMSRKKTSEILYCNAMPLPRCSQESQCSTRG